MDKKSVIISALAFIILDFTISLLFIIVPFSLSLILFIHPLVKQWHIMEHPLILEYIGITLITLAGMIPVIIISLGTHWLFDKITNKLQKYYIKQLKF